MATKVFTNYDLSTGSANSTAVTDVGDLTIQATVTASTDDIEIKYILKAKEGDGNYVPVLDGYKNEISFHTRGNQSKRVTVLGVNSESAVVAIETNGATGTLNVETTKTTNPNA